MNRPVQIKQVPPLKSLALAEPVLTDPKQAVAVTISGKVSSPSGEALPGVTVLLKGTTIGAATGPDGIYSLQAPAATGTLVFSFIGFITKEVPINGRSLVNVTLTEDTKALEEVVVVGYGTQKKGDVTGAVGSVKFDQEISSRPMVEFGQALSG